MRRIRVLFNLAIFIAISASAARALEAKQLKTATDRLGSWIIEQYDVKEKVYKYKNASCRDLRTVAVIVTALCNSPRYYREANGPYISEPVKFLVASITAHGNNKLQTPETIAWVKLALTATKNEKYEAILKQLSPDAKLPEAQIKVETPTADQETLKALLYSLYSKPIEKESATNIAESLMKLQQKNGSLGDNLQANALALEILNICYKTITTTEKSKK